MIDTLIVTLVNSGEVDGLPIEPHGLCSDDRGRLFVADGSNSRILVLNSYNGYLMQIIHLEHLGDIYELGYSNVDSFIIIQHSTSGNKKEQISVFSLDDS